MDWFYSTPNCDCSVLFIVPTLGGTPTPPYISISNDAPCFEWKLLQHAMLARYTHPFSCMGPGSWTALVLQFTDIQALSNLRNFFMTMKSVQKNHISRNPHNYTPFNHPYIYFNWECDEISTAVTLPSADLRPAHFYRCLVVTYDLRSELCSKKCMVLH